ELLLCHGTVCVVGKIRDLILQLSKSSIYSTKPTSINKPLQIDFRSDQLQATNQETYFMMRIMLSLMAGKHLFSPHPLS
ncbi:hypothetical protein ACVURZ_22625, partial [Escherichia coli]